MKFSIHATSIRNDPQYLLDRYPCLNDYNFEVKEYERESLRVVETYITIDTIEQLIKLMDAVDEELVIINGPEIPAIEIYDDYRE